MSEQKGKYEDGLQHVDCKSREWAGRVCNPSTSCVALALIAKACLHIANELAELNGNLSDMKEIMKKGKSDEL